MAETRHRDAYEHIHTLSRRVMYVFLGKLARFNVAQRCTLECPEYLGKETLLMHTCTALRL